MKKNQDSTPQRKPNGPDGILAQQARVVAKVRALAGADVDILERCREKNIDPGGLPRGAREIIAEQKYDRTTVKLDIDVPAWLYGYLCTAAAVHGLPGWREAVKLYLEETVTDWANNRYFLDDWTL